MATAIRPIPLQNAAVRPIRVVIIDDSAVVRGFLARWIADCADLEVAGTANDGLEGVAIVSAKRPDVVVLDIEMPRLDGLQALPEILAAAPGSRVLISSRLTVPGARACMQCLEAGAADVIGKPAFQKNLATLNEFRTDLLAKIRGLGSPLVRQSPAGPLRSSSVPTDNGRRITPALAEGLRMPEVILLGASTGGPAAINEFLAGAKPFLGRLPMVIAQHMPGLFTAVFADHLVRVTGMVVREAVHGERVRPGVIYVAPGGHHTLLTNREGQARLVINDDAPVRFSRPSIDCLLETGAAVFGARAWCVLLTGMGQDGLIGAQAIAAAGGQIFAQDEKSSVVWGMPGAVVRAGIAHAVAAPHDLAVQMGAMIAGAKP